jgi:predicted ATPase/class 3 adenylate cyclase
MQRYREEWVTCPVCGFQNEAGRKFCGECGAPLALLCASCGAANSPGMKFCGECGSPLLPGVTRPPTVEIPTRSASPEAERRLVSVLFADLVGFTTLSERRDPEEVRDLLTRYFDTCRTLVERYGGTVEKFIGDAVMAVWGTPTAQEDDAERAVRTALDLTQAVAALGAEVGAPDLEARAGVLTGEAAVTVGADAQGMVMGDLVNTASRVQAVAEPGTVLVGEATRRATEAAVIYQDAGSHELKGKSEPTTLYCAVRVIAGRGGALRSAGLEAPFVGRERELRLVKELFHTAGDEGKAHLVSVTGIAGIGKSRLSWEFFKYIDGLAATAYWHRGRCLAYGEGVTYWALAEMIRGRAEILEAEEASTAGSKLHAAVERYVSDPEERSWVEPRLAHILGLEERSSRDREDLFAAARLFFERLSDRYPTILVFEDMQWAEPALVDFVEYLLDWSRNHPLFVLALARPELAERHPGWASGKRNFTSLFLESLSPQAMDELLSGLAPGLPEELRSRILERAEGVPLYAVETVRMLIDRGLLVREQNQYRPVGPVEDLEVPETLHALIAARLDGLSQEERRLLQDAAVLGKTFSMQGLAALTGSSPDSLDAQLASLVRKEVLSQHADPRSPERGQFGFLQDLVRRVAYETMSKKERKARHLAAADFLQEASGHDEDEVVEVVAAHLLDAIRAQPEAPEAAAIRTRALDALARAGRRAGSLGATEEARRYYERAAELTEDGTQRADLLEHAGIMARRSGRSDDALAHYEEAIRLFEEAGQTHPAARVSARIGEILWDRDQLDQGVERLEASFSILSGEEADADFAVLAAELARFHFFRGDLERSLDRVDRALEVAEALWLPETISQALNTKHLVLKGRDRHEEAQAVLKHALEIAVENDAPQAALRAYINLSNMMAELDRSDDGLQYQSAGIALARRVGNRWQEWFLLGHLTQNRYARGEWEEAIATAAEIPDPDETPDAHVGASVASWGLIELHVARGDVESAEHLWNKLWTAYVDTADVQNRAAAGAVRSLIDRTIGRHQEALERAREALEWRGVLSITHTALRLSWVNALEAALAAGKPETAVEVLGMIEALPPGHVTQFLRANLMRFQARIRAVREEHDGVEAGFKSAAGMFREMKRPFDVAVVQLEHHEWLASQGRGEEEAALDLAAEARETFARLEAGPWLERLDRTALTARVI